MSNVELYDHQIEALGKMKNGCILCGGTGSGKSRTSLAYFYTKVCEGSLKVNGAGKWSAPKTPRDLYIITTAKKRDTNEWLGECVPFHLSDDPSISVSNIKVTIDSWNNIAKYKKVYGAMFIFDEQKVSGRGAWVKAFLQITKKNQWILLSATPGDTWSDYIPVFIANGFYKNRTQFNNDHIIFDPYVNYPRIKDYVNKGQLIRYRRQILIRMDSLNRAKQIHHKVEASYDKQLYSRVFRDRWDVYDNVPIEETGKLCYLLRKVVNSDPSRIKEAKELIANNPRTIVFYNYTYEVEIVRAIAKELGIKCKEWNGSQHDPLPKGDSWIYAVQYNAGAEGWNCITTDTIIFYSQSYSYRATVQAAGRIDRLNTPYKELHYYHLRSSAPIDLAIARALSQKRNFNEKAFLGR